MNLNSRRDFLKAAAAGTIAASSYPHLMMAKDTPQQKPNVVILFIDDLGYGDLSCFGNKRVKTPYIDSLAENGVKCTMSYVTNPPCSPSRCSLLTGMYAQRFGKSGMARGMPIPDDHPTLAEFMRDAGYVTGQIGKWDIGSKDQPPQKRGFMEVARGAPGSHYDVTRADETKAYRTDLDGDYMVEFVERNKDKPFFLYFSPLAIHAPLGGTPKEYQDRAGGGNAAAHDGALIALDDQVGKLLATLKKNSLENSTLILLTGDNGPNISAGGGTSAPYRGGKLPGNTIYEGWVHTPTIAAWPGVIPPGTTFDGLMCTLDFYATAAALAGKPLPERCDGKNLLPFLKKEKEGDVHEYLFWHNADPTDMKHRNLYAVRWKNWRLVKYPDGWKLFDLKEDPEERKDVSAGKADVVATMQKEYEAFVASLPPIKPGTDYAIPKSEPGWGWIIGPGK